MLSYTCIVTTKNKHKFIEGSGKNFLILEDFFGNRTEGRLMILKWNIIQ